MYSIAFHDLFTSQSPKNDFMILLRKESLPETVFLRIVDASLSTIDGQFSYGNGAAGAANIEAHTIFIQNIYISDMV